MDLGRSVQNNLYVRCAKRLVVHGVRGDNEDASSDSHTGGNFLLRLVVSAPLSPPMCAITWSAAAIIMSWPGRAHKHFWRTRHDAEDGFPSGYTPILSFIHGLERSLPTHHGMDGSPANFCCFLWCFTNILIDKPQYNQQLPIKCYRRAISGHATLPPAGLNAVCSLVCLWYHLVWDIYILLGVLRFQFPIFSLLLHFSTLGGGSYFWYSVYNPTLFLESIFCLPLSCDITLPKHHPSGSIC